MRRIGLLLIIVLILVFAWWMWRPRSGSPYVAAPLEVNTVVDSIYKYHLPLNQKTRHISISAHEFIVWTFDADSTVDSVTAVFSGTSPFAQSHFEFSDSLASSGAPVVLSGATVYNYTITVYPHGHSPVTVDPGIIIDM